jgi:sec-independent protein translocase protein TatC
MILNLIELRNRLIYSLATFISISMISFFYKESMLYFVVKSSLFQIKNDLPFFIYTNLTEVFATYFKLAVLTGIYLTLPVFLLHSWLFIRTGLYKSEYHSTKNLFLIFTNLWLFNNFFIYNLILPLIWNFFLRFGTNGSKSPLSLFFEIKLTEYVEFLLSTITCCSLSLQFFMAILLWTVTNNQYTLFSFKENRRYVYTLIIVFAALITPPDLSSQLILSAPFLFTYEFLLLSLLIKNEYRFYSFHFK